MRNKAEIEAEIKWLLKNKIRIPRFTIFNDDNHEAIDAQLEILRSPQLLDEDSVDSLADDSEWLQLSRDSAMDVWRWMNGEDDDTKPSDNWKVLLK